FAAVPGAETSVWGLADTGDELLVASLGGLGIVRKGKVLERREIVATSVLALQPTLALLGTEQALHLLTRIDGRWNIGAAIAGVNGEVRAMARDADGSVWVAVTNRGYFRILGFTDAALPD